MTEAQRLNARWRDATDREYMHRQILIASVSCEPWGFDAMRYEFKDGSWLVYDKIVKEWKL